MSRRYSFEDDINNNISQYAPAHSSSRQFRPSNVSPNVTNSYTTRPTELTEFNDVVSPISSPAQSPHREPLSREHLYDNSQSLGVGTEQREAPSATDGIYEQAFGEPHRSANRNIPAPISLAPAPYYGDFVQMSPYDNNDEHEQQYIDRDSYTTRQSGSRGYPFLPAVGISDKRPSAAHADSQSSLMPLVPATIAASTHSSNQSSHRFTDGIYSDSSFKQYSGNHHPDLGSLDPSMIEDDGDEGLNYNQSQRSSILALNTKSSGKDYGLEDWTVKPPAGYEKHAAEQEIQRSAWLDKQKKSTNKYRWLIGGAIVLLILGAIGGGLAALFLHRKNNPVSSSDSNGDSAASDSSKNGDLSISSAEIKSLMNNKNLHKVFPGIDYTPINTQYPECLHNPPSQNNVTRDLAVLSQLTNQVRLYGTDCNQTEMVLHAINQLDLSKTMKVWLGVWQATNASTNARQLSHMYSLLETYGTKQFAGVIVGNECIFREDMSVTALETILTNVKSNFTAKGYNLTVSTSDIGVSWTASLASVSDYLMSNIHPFFAGVPAASASSWTSSFFTTSMLALQPSLSKNIIAETGWPSGGGTDCGSATVTTCANGSVAGIDGMNKFMSDWVCAALTNGTNYFMFEAFDEPWKISFNTKGQEWEDKWGLMDVNRNLKNGLVIPDCGGVTIPALF